MKKFVAVFLSVILALLLISCKSSKDISKISSTNSEITSDIISSSEETVSSDVSDVSSTEPETSNESSSTPTSSVTSTPVKGNALSGNNQNSSTPPPAVVPNIPQLPESPSTGGSSSETTTTPSEEEGGDEEELEYYYYATEGTLKDWLCIGDIVYYIFYDPSYIIAMDSSSCSVLFEDELSGCPERIKLINDELWISYSNTKRIIIYDKNTFAEKRTILLNFNIHSFDVYNDYLYYSLSDEYATVCRYNLKTMENMAISGKGNPEVCFYNPDIVVNKDLKLLYVSESGNSKSAVKCYDAETLELKSEFVFQFNGFNNNSRKTFLVGDYYYWGNFKLKASDVSSVFRFYHGNYKSGMLYVDEKYVITKSGFYENNSIPPSQGNTTDESISPMNLEYSSAVITKSENMLIYQEKIIFIFPNIE